MSEHTQPVAELPNPELRPQDTVSSFTTSHGSIYTYDDEGHTTRFKTATGEEQPRQDLTVFVDVTPKDAGAVAAAYLFRSSTKSTRIEVVETQPDDSTRIVTQIDDITDPSRLMLATFKGDIISRTKPASLMPRIGAYVYDSRRFEENGVTRTERHLGHKVTDIQRK